jgi:hypothetical protein
MTPHTCSPGITGRPVVEDDPAGSTGVVPGMRCADAARLRGEPLAASAVPYSRFLLLEVPGPWGTSPLDGKHIEAGVASQLSGAATASGTHVLLIRRPAAGPGAQHRSMAWAIADASPGVGRVLWGTWRDPADLLGLDLAAGLSSEAGATGPQRLALVCTNGKRDQCCAVRGRPVARAIAAATGWDTWECSHLGGHRFAATMLLLPTGDMFGWLDQDSALEVTRRFDAGQLMPSHYRGRCGQPEPVQAALHAAGVRLGDYRRGAFQASQVRPLAADGRPSPAAEHAERWEVEIIHRTRRHPERVYRVVVAGTQVAPAFLSCADSAPKAEVRYAALSFSRLP